MTCRNNCLHYNICVWSTFKEVRDATEMKKHCGDFLDKNNIRKRGYWKDDPYNNHRKFCSICGGSMPKENSHGFACKKNYCPACGAAMIVKGDGVNANSEYE